MCRFGPLAAFFLAVAGCVGAVADSSLSVDLAISDVIPSEIPSRGGVEVIVLGQNFREGTKVFVGSQEVGLVTRQDATRLSFLAPPASYGRGDLLLRSPNGQEVRWKRGLLYYAATLDFEVRPLPVEGGKLPFHVGDFDFGGQPLLGDLDGDGRADVVVVSGEAVSAAGIQLQLDVLHNRDHGRRLVHLETLSFTFANPSPIPSIALFDVNGDGRADLLIGRELRLAGPDGQLAAPFGLTDDAPLAYAGPGVVGDFDGDGARELALLTFDSQDPSLPAETRLQLYRIGADGQVESLRRINDVARPILMQAADVDHDGFADLVWHSHGGVLHARFGPDLSKADEWSYAVAAASNLPLGEFQLLAATGAAGPDLLLENAMLFPNQGRGFGAPRPVSPMVASDLRPNPFGALGLSANRCTEGLCLTRWAQGLPQESSFMSIPKATSEVSAAGVWSTVTTWACGEFDGQSGPDFLTYSSGRFFAAYGVTGRPAPALPTYGLSDRFSLPIEDPLDLAQDTVNWRRHLVKGRFGTHGLLAVVLNRGVTLVSGGPAPATTAEIAFPEESLRPVWDVEVCDLDGNGMDDLVVSAGSIEIDFLQTVLVREGGLSLGQKVDLSGRGVTQVSAGQFTRDRLCDVIVSTHPDSSSSTNFLFLAGSEAGLVAAPAVSTTQPARSFDFNGDGLDDLYQLDNRFRDGSYFSAGLELLISNGDGTFTPRLVAFPEGTWMIEAAFQRTTASQVEAIFHGAVAGNTRRFWRATLDQDYSLQLLGSSDELPAVSGLIAGDLNGDGQLDALANASSQMFVARDGHLVPEGTLAPPDDGTALMLLDLNGDHLDDLVYFASTRPLRLGVLFNHSH